MTQISIRFFKDDAEVGRIDADLPAEAPEIVAACREWVDEWMAASTMDSDEDVASFEEAFARQFGVRPNQSLEERLRDEQARAKRMIENRLRAEKALAERPRKEIELPKPVQNDRVAYAQRILKERDECKG